VTQRTAELQESNRRLQLMSFTLDQVREAAYLVDEKGSIFYVNQEACRAHGRSAEELCQMTVMDIDPDFSADRIAPGWKAILATGSITFETRHLRRDGSSYPVEVHTSAIRFQDRDFGLSLARDITERKEAERRLRDSYAQLQELMSRRELDREEERKRIAHELHDELGQCLTALRIGIGTLRYRQGKDDAWLDERLAALVSQVDETIQVVRSVATMLRPPALDMGMGPALDGLASQFRQTTGLACVVDLPSDLCIPTEEAAIALYRIVQEALTNVARHAKASGVRIAIRQSALQWQLDISDDGAGFEVWTAQTKSLGLLGIRERAQQLGGEFHVESVPGEGTRISVKIPVSRLVRPAVQG
jgi:PAS domain S-box-containing protein